MNEGGYVNFKRNSFLYSLTEDSNFI